MQLLKKYLRHASGEVRVVVKQMDFELSQLYVHTAESPLLLKC